MNKTAVRRQGGARKARRRQLPVQNRPQPHYSVSCRAGDHGACYAYRINFCDCPCHARCPDPSDLVEPGYRGQGPSDN